MQMSGGLLLPPVQKLVATIFPNFSILHSKSTSRHLIKTDIPLDATGKISHNGFYKEGSS